AGRTAVSTHRSPCRATPSRHSRRWRRSPVCPPPGSPCWRWRCPAARAGVRTSGPRLPSPPIRDQDRAPRRAGRAAPPLPASTPPRAGSLAPPRPADGSWLGERVTDTVRHDRYAVSSAEVLRVQRHREGDAAALDAQRGAVDVLEGVAFLVIV